MNLRTKKTVLMAMFNIILLLCFFTLTMESVNVHEHAHKEIAENHGCVDWRIDQNWKGGGEFECLEHLNVPTEVSQQEAMLHSVNEIVTYNTSAVSSSIIIGVLLLMNVMFLRWILDE